MIVIVLIDTHFWILTIRVKAKIKNLFSEAFRYMRDPAGTPAERRNAVKPIVYDTNHLNSHKYYLVYFYSVVS